MSSLLPVPTDIVETPLPGVYLGENVPSLDYWFAWYLENGDHLRDWLARCDEQQHRLLDWEAKALADAVHPCVDPSIA